MRAAGIALSLGMDVKIVDIQGGKDPADLVLANPEDWKNALRTAKPVIEFELNNVLKEVTEPRKIPKSLRDRVFPFIALVESETDKAFFIKKASDLSGLSEQAIWDDVRSVAKKIQEESRMPPSGPVAAPQGRFGESPGGAALSPRPTRPAGTTSEAFRDSSMTPVRRIDLVERRMLGLLDLMEKAGHPTVADISVRIKKIAGDSYEDMMSRAKQIENDLAFEAEAFFGADASKWDAHMSDLIANFEEDVVAQELIATMNELRRKERENDQAAVAELAKKCQILSVRKADLSKQRK